MCHSACYVLTDFATSKKVPSLHENVNFNFQLLGTKEQDNLLLAPPDPTKFIHTVCSFTCMVIVDNTKII